MEKDKSGDNQERREVFTPEQRRRARETMSRRWTLARWLKWAAVGETVLTVGILIWDIERGRQVADFLAWPIAIKWGAVAALLGADSVAKFKRPA